MTARHGAREQLQRRPPVARPQLKNPPRPRADRVAEAITGGTGSGTEAREAATERAVLRMVARLFSAFAE